MISMLTIEDLLKNMKKHFPRWMDIRRKITSSGSLLLESLAEETSEIEKAIEDYKKDFFIDNYYEKEDDVLAFLYKVNIGIIDINDITLIAPDYEIVEDENIFYSNDNVSYFNEGVLYFKEDLKEIQYAINGYKSTVSLEKMHIWNVFDEFAAFVGLKRFLWETNKELLNRILNKSNRTINSSEDGLKQAIIANLTNIDPNLKKDEILIEKPTPENLMKYYNEFNTLLDHLNEINRDIYKNKKWDIDVWNFDKKTIDYIPHAWDVVLNYYVNGIGDNEDLKVSIVDSSSETDVSINFYKKTISAVNLYIKNHNIKEDFEITLRKYNNELMPDKVKYSIVASEAIKIDPSSIKIELHQQEIEKKEVLIQDIADGYIVNTDVIDNSILDSNYKYKLKFIPTNKFGDFKIDELKQCHSDNSQAVNLIKYQNGFKYNDIFNESVICGKIIKHATNKYHFNYIENVKKTSSGLECIDESKHAFFMLNIDGCSNEILSYNYEYNEVPLLYSNIKLKNCYIDNDLIISDTVDDEKYIEINAELNSLSMMICGPYLIEYSINDGEFITKSNYNNIQSEFKIDKYKTPVKLKMKINFIEQKSKIFDIKYSKFDFIINTEFDKILNSFDKEYLPYTNKNNLLIKMKSYTGSPLILKYVHIGSEIEENDYYGDIVFDPSKGNKLIAKFNDCRLQLTKLNKNTNEVIEVIEDYIPYKIYSSKNNESAIELLLNNYEKIESINEEDCEINTISYSSNNIQYLLKIPYNKTAYKVNVSGLSKNRIKTFDLDFILSKKGYSTENFEFFVAKNSNKIIAKRIENDLLDYITINRRDLFENLNIKNIKIINKENDNIIAKFMQNNDSNLSITTDTLTNNFEGFFDNLTFVPVQSNIYSAINEYSMILPEIDKIKIVNTFSNGYNSKRKMFYEINSLNDNYSILFEKNLSVYSLDEDTITIKNKEIENMKYNYEEIDAKITLALNSRIELPEYIFLPTKEKINLKEYMIVNYENVIFKTKDDDIENIDKYIYSESMYIDICGFNKLKYSNIDQIISINKKNKNTVNVLIENVHYKILYNQGIIVWLDKSLINDQSVVDIKYYIKIPYCINYELDKLYEKVKHDTSALELIENIEINELNENSIVKLDSYDAYADSDIVTIHCKEPGFSASIDNGILRLSKKTEENTVAVKSGYYYMDGIEYYLFANDNSIDIEKIDDVYLNNVFKSNKKYHLKQEANNFIKNSSMINNISNTIFDVNLKEKNTISNQIINTLTACNTYNYWNTIGCNMSIVNGLNGQGIKFDSIENMSGCAYVKLSDFYDKNLENTLSFYMLGSKSKAYLGIDKKINVSNSIFNKESVVNILSEIKESSYQKNIYTINLPKIDYDYFLIIKGDCIIDDILIMENSKHDIELHKKNIDHLGFDIEEYIYSEYATRLYLTDKNGSFLKGAEIKNNKIINTSNVQWGYTSLKKITSYNDYKKCILNNVDLIQFNDKCIAKTTNSKGSILTYPIYIGNKNTIKNIAFKINNIMFDEMKDIKVTMLTANSVNDDFKAISQHISNIDVVSGNFLKSYIKLLVEIPANKVINNIEVFIEYLSNDLYHPNNLPTIEGIYMSKILDINYPERYIIKKIDFSENNMPIENYVFQIRASRENNEKTVWTDWKTINIKDGKIVNRIVFENYKYFQFMLTLKGDNASIKLNHIDLEVI